MVKDWVCDGDQSSDTLLLYQFGTFCLLVVHANIQLLGFSSQIPKGQHARLNTGISVIVMNVKICITTTINCRHVDLVV